MFVRFLNSEINDWINKGFVAAEKRISKSNLRDELVELFPASLQKDVDVSFEGRTVIMTLRVDFFQANDEIEEVDDTDTLVPEVFNSYLEDDDLEEVEDRKRDAMSEFEEAFVESLLLQLPEHLRDNVEAYFENRILTIVLTFEFTNEKTILSETTEFIRSLFTNYDHSDYEFDY